MGAAERIRAGDLAARVPEGEKDDELVSLSRAFNRMTYQIQSQQRELIEANRQLDERRRFTETVLTGVSAGSSGWTGAAASICPTGRHRRCSASTSICRSARISPKSRPKWPGCSRRRPGAPTG
jgi:hypothetical protein